MFNSCCIFFPRIIRLIYWTYSIISYAALAKSTFVKTTVDRRVSAFLLRVELLNSQVQILEPTQNKKHPRLTPWVSFISGAPCRIRTCDLRIRNPMLYPAGLRAHVHYFILSFRKFQVLHKSQKNTARMGSGFMFWTIHPKTNQILAPSPVLQPSACHNTPPRHAPPLRQ